jgi:hypothetical protein
MKEKMCPICGKPVRSDALAMRARSIILIIFPLPKGILAGLEKFKTIGFLSVQFNW